MNYDTTISHEVSLSKVLDEMIVDGADFELIVQFLKSHESNIKDIYVHSAFVYDLYDLISHPYRIDEFLVEHIMDLPEPYKYCVMANHMKFGSVDKYSKYNLAYFKDIYNRESHDVHSSGFRDVMDIGGFIQDGYFLTGETDMVDWLNDLGLKNDVYEIRRFVRHSYCMPNVFNVRVFNRLNIYAKFLILSSVENGIFIGFAYNLLKQLAYIDHIDEFNWVLNVLGLEKRGFVKRNMVRSIMSAIPDSMVASLNQNPEFSEVVFDMNLLETQFDVLDLFLYIYIANPRLRDQMMEALDLVDFFNLGFDWRELEFIKHGV